MTIEHRIVWAEIPAADFGRAKAFYAAVLGETLIDEEGGPNPIALLPYGGKGGRSANIYPGTPATAGAGPTIHLAVECKLAEAMTRIKGAGGQVVSDVITIPAGSFFYGIDTEGNSIGIFEG
ncbi:VOC family protein [Acuticoccus sp. MNP-M23]|uniref:VOC family protein n=1 Tax=Acuticoccus sp. MNP-M23 TaxID=3072793 RepID=UPI002814F9E4|nr:VOC family protein [Acuticoccus sp. MNP-M23]WMS42499.1 VOC family protein [Acuticoccus sp. MNP-M23]